MAIVKIVNGNGNEHEIGKVKGGMKEVWEMGN